MAKLFCYILLIVFFATAAITIVTAAAEAPIEPSSQALPTQTEDSSCSFGFNFVKCWVSILKVEGCAAEIIGLVTGSSRGNVISTHCCSAIRDVSTECFSVLGGLFAPVLKGHCIA